MSNRVRSARYQSFRFRRFLVFLAIAKHQNFRRAGLELGVSASALSYALKGLESRLGVRLLNRTNRSVTLTAAGEELQTAITGPFDPISLAAENLNRYRDEPTGRIRLNVPDDAASLLLGPVLPTFIERYPEVEIGLSVNNQMIDIIEGGYDAGIRYGGTVPADVVAQGLSPTIRWVVAGTPRYFERFGRPLHPLELQYHRCLRFRLGNCRLYRWEFIRAKERIQVSEPGTMTLDDSRTILSLLAQDVGLMYAPEPLVRPLVQKGSIELVQEDWAPFGAGYQIYYSSRRQLPTGLRLLIDLIREINPLGL